MEAVIIDPRAAAEALGVDLDTLAQTIRGWASDELNRVDCYTRQDLEADGDDLARFDAGVARARLHVESFVAVEQAWREDNPDAFTEDE